MTRRPVTRRLVTTVCCVGTGCGGGTVGARVDRAASVAAKAFLSGETVQVGLRKAGWAAVIIACGTSNGKGRELAILWKMGGSLL